MTSQTLKQRINCGYQHNDRMVNAVKQCGKRNLKGEILATGLTRDEASETEKRLIAEYDSTNPDIGYNVSYGGVCTFAGLKHTEAHKKHMSDLYRGKVWSEESLRKMKQAHAKERHPCVAMDSDGNVVKRYESLLAAAKDVGSCTTTISRVCNRKNNQYKGLYWKLEKGVVA